MMRPLTCSGQPAFGLTHNFICGDGLVHLLEDPQELGRSAGAIDADDIRPGFGQYLGSFFRAIAQDGPVVAGEGDRDDHRAGAGFFRRLDSLTRFIQIIHRLDDDQICSGGA